MRVAWVGAGVMGRHMCGHLLSAGHSVSVFSRTSARCAPLVERGARLATSPADAAEGADVVFTMVGTPSDVEEVTLGPEGALKALKPGGLLVDCTTSTPSLAVTIAAWCASQGVLALDAPVSGGDVGAEAGTLSIMCGGSAKAFETASPLLDVMGSKIVLMGGAGSGQHTKMCNQVLVCSNMVGMAESLLYAHRAGIDANAMIDVVGKGAAASFVFNHLGPKAAAGDHAPGFMIEHMSKDLGIALQEAERMGLQLPGLGLARRLYAGLLRHGHGKEGTQALVLALEDVDKFGAPVETLS